MKKSINLTQVTCRFGETLIKSENIDKAKNLVVFKVREYELSKLKNDKEYKTCLEKLNDAYPTKSAEKLTDKQVKQALGTDAELYKKHLECIAQVAEDMDKTGVTPADFNALADVDKTFILLEVHKNVKAVSVPVAGDFEAPVRKYFEDGTATGAVKDLFRSAFHNAVGTAGELFKGVKIKKSDIADTDIRYALAGFVSGAGRAKTKDDDGNEKLDDYKWILNTGKDRIAKVGSDLFAVILESRKDILQYVAPKQEQPKEEPSPIGMKDTKKEKPKK